MTRARQLIAAVAFPAFLLASAASAQIGVSPATDRPDTDSADFKADSPDAEDTAPEVLPPAIWNPVDAQDLLYYAQQVERDGLNPADYDLKALQDALRSTDIAAISAAANRTFDKLATDLALGHVPAKARIDWHIPDKDLPLSKLRWVAQDALSRHDVRGALDGLLPTHPQYLSLRSALEVTPATDKVTLDRIRLNMDRWRWLPRELGERYIIVNVPSYHATLVEKGQNRWKERAIAGSTRTPTPQLTAMATGVVLNPWWEVPKSIEGEVRGKNGFVPLKGDKGQILRWRQPPGPSNALGQVKFIMPNSKAIYLHDTNARSRFNDKTRALSHGCIRTQHILDLATVLLGDDGGQWDDARVKKVLASKKTVNAKFVNPLPVYIVYFSAAALTDGRIVTYKDIYGRDSGALKALQSADGGAPTKGGVN